MRDLSLYCFVCLGGVYNSPEANAYWARRFGFSSGGQNGLRLVMEKFNQEAAENRRAARP